MGRVTTPLTIINPMDADRSLRCEALVDTGSTTLMLPNAWRDRLGALHVLRRVSAVLSSGEEVAAEVCGPVKLRIDGFQEIGTEIAFIPMEPESDGGYEALLGHVPLQLASAKVDFALDRLVPGRGLEARTVILRDGPVAPPTTPNR